MIGEKLGSYVLLDELGTGSMGTVYHAMHPRTGATVALKLIPSKILYDAARRERFLQEVLAASEVHHPAFCPILEIGDENDDFFVVMPLLEGRRLNQVMKGKPLPVHCSFQIAMAVGEALMAAHEAGAVHRGLKPANIWVLDDGSVRITDLCLARFTEYEQAAPARPGRDSDDFAQTLIPLTTLSYMSPEQVRGSGLDHRSDIFSLGVVLYEMITGRHPFSARNSLLRLTAIVERQPPPATDLRPGLPVEVDAILRRALAKDPSDRYGSMREMLAEMRRVCRNASEQHTGAMPSPAPGMVRKMMDVLRSLFARMASPSQTPH